MTVRHISTLYFGARREAARKRVQRLKHFGYLTMRRTKLYEPALYAITQKAFELLHRQGLLNEYPKLRWTAHERRFRVSDLTLKHELAVMDVKEAFVAAAKAADIEILAFDTWPAMYQFKAWRSSSDAINSEKVLAKPDGYIRIKESAGVAAKEYRFFLEVDRSTEALDTLLRRLSCYVDYYRSGGLAVRCGLSPSEFKRMPFRVLMVFRTAERRKGFIEKAVLRKLPVRTFALLVTADEAVQNPFGAVQLRP